MIFTMKDIYIKHHLNPLRKFTSSRTTELKDMFPVQHFSNYLEVHPSQHENSQKLCDETEDLILSLMEIRWKLRQQHD